jgi:HrpA-like RNA helicase
MDNVATGRSAPQNVGLQPVEAHDLIGGKPVIVKLMAGISLRHGEVRRIDLAESMLMVLSMGFGPFERFPWLDPPEADAVERARGTLVAIGAVDAGGTLTALGRRLARIPAHPRLGRVLLEASSLGVLPGSKRLRPATRTVAEASAKMR